MFDPKKIVSDKSLLIFCLWIWISTLLYYFDLQPFSMLYSAFFAVIFTIYYSLIYKKNHRPIEYKIGIVVFEIGILGLNIYKHFYIDKKPLIVFKDILFNILLFLLYLVFLSLNNTNFYKLYFVDLLMNSNI